MQASRHGKACSDTLAYDWQTLQKKGTRLRSSACSMTLAFSKDRCAKPRNTTGELLCFAVVEPAHTI